MQLKTHRRIKREQRKNGVARGTRTGIAKKMPFRLLRHI